MTRPEAVSPLNNYHVICYNFVPLKLHVAFKNNDVVYSNFNIFQMMCTKMQHIFFKD